jgi:hypothetical protein
MPRDISPVGGEFTVFGVDDSVNPPVSFQYRNAMQFDLGKNPPERTLWRPQWPAGLLVNPILKLDFSLGQLAGDLRAVGGLGSVGNPRPGLARIDEGNGAVPEQAVRGFEGIVRTLACALGGDAVGGDFRSVEDSPHFGIAVFTGAGGVLDTRDPGLNSGVFDIPPIGNTVYVAGGFTRVGSVLDRAGAQPGWATTMMQYLDRIVVGGTFSAVGGEYNDPSHRNNNYLNDNFPPAGGLIELPPRPQTDGACA